MQLRIIYFFSDYFSRNFVTLAKECEITINPTCSGLSEELFGEPSFTDTP